MLLENFLGFQATLQFFTDSCYGFFTLFLIFLFFLPVFLFFSFFQQFGRIFWQKLHNMKFLFQVSKIIFKPVIPVFKCKVWFFFVSLASEKNKFKKQGQSCKEKDSYSCVIK